VVWAKEQAVRRYDCRDSWAKDQWGRQWLTPKSSSTPAALVYQNMEWAGGQNNECQDLI
jgi:hypothetical protein